MAMKSEFNRQMKLKRKIEKVKCTQRINYMGPSFIHVLLLISSPSKVLAGNKYYDHYLLLIHDLIQTYKFHNFVRDK